MNIAIEPGTLLSLITIVTGITIYSLRSRHAERMQFWQKTDPGFITKVWTPSTKKTWKTF